MVVGSKAKGVHDKCLGALHIRELFVIDGLHVRDVGQRTDTKAEDGQFSVIDDKGDDGQFVDLQRPMSRNGMQIDGRCTWIAMFGKAIRNRLHESVGRSFIGIDVHFAELTERTEVVNTSYTASPATVRPHRKPFGKEGMTVAGDDCFLSVYANL